MNQIYDVVVVGLGVMGCATAWRLSSSNASVLCVDSGPIINYFGASYGASRIFRQAYWEGDKYLPLLSLSNTLWRSLDASSEIPLIFNSGALFVGPKASGVVPKSKLTACAGNIDHDVYSASQIMDLFPAFQVTESMEALSERGGYVIAADHSMLHMLNRAVEQGVKVSFGTSVLDVSRTAKGLLVKMTSGESIRAGRVVITAGYGSSGLLFNDLHGLLSPQCVPVYWFRPKKGRESIFSDSFPAFLYELEDRRLLYGTPEVNSVEPGVKIGFHNAQRVEFDREAQRRPVDQKYISQMAECIESVLPDLHPCPYRSKKCVYTMTPDESFIIGESSKVSGVFYAAVCSGHGFKFATGVGEVLANAAVGMPLATEVLPFDRSRFDLKLPRVRF